MATTSIKITWSLLTMLFILICIAAATIWYGPINKPYKPIDTFKADSIKRDSFYRKSVDSLTEIPND